MIWHGGFLKEVTFGCPNWDDIAQGVLEKRFA